MLNIITEARAIGLLFALLIENVSYGEKSDWELSTFGLLIS